MTNEAVGRTRTDGINRTDAPQKQNGKTAARSGHQHNRTFPHHDRPKPQTRRFENAVRTIRANQAHGELFFASEIVVHCSLSRRQT